MTEKRFELFVGNNYGVKTVDGDVIFDSIRSIADAEVLVELLNDLLDENKQLKEENKELRQDNDIKFWKLQCLQSSNNNQVMLFELGRAMQQGYEVSDKFKQYLEEIKEHDKEIQEKHKRLFEEKELME